MTPRFFVSLEGCITEESIWSGVVETWAWRDYLYLSIFDETSLKSNSRLAPISPAKTAVVFLHLMFEFQGSKVKNNI